MITEIEDLSTPVSRQQNVSLQQVLKWAKYYNDNPQLRDALIQEQQSGRNPRVPIEVDPPHPFSNNLNFQIRQLPDLSMCLFKWTLAVIIFPGIGNQAVAINIVGFSGVPTTTHVHAYLGTVGGPTPTQPQPIHISRLAFVNPC
ncbi:hypothetical protein [Paenibacillus rubinfantis]|uniref:hypothetical protein n=1 Tax=Paenibacillus rubinfantis TaxID=1720296 RepID=UPI0011DD478B|nr:hypothetical protein [Paenibacillus rubinfantis]